MNRILCSNMTIRFVDEELDNISFYVEPEARFIPPHELTEEVQKLQGFEWRGEERPELSDLIIRPLNEEKETEKGPVLPPEQMIDPEGLPEKKKQTLKSLKTKNE